MNHDKFFKNFLFVKTQMNPELLFAIKNKNKNSKPCQIIFPKNYTTTKQQISYPIQNETRILFKNENELKQIRKNTKELVVLPPHCNLERKKYKLKNLVNSSNIFNHGNKKYIRMFHGTNSRHLSSILEEGLKLIGGGALGNGFYMTPSLIKAELYNIKQQQLKENKKYSPIILELFLPIKTSVSALDYHIENSNLFTEKNSFWQFICKNEHFLNSIKFNIWMYE